MDKTEIAVLIARGQFGFTIGMHIVLAAFSIGLANYLMVLEGLWLWKRQAAYIELYNYWLKIFALNFAVGAVSGVVLEYEFGTNWSELSIKAAAVIGPMMMYEVVVAFFLESGFIGVMLFAMKKVGERLHFAATVCVAMGSLFSAFWILSANSWMQTPAGYRVAADGRFIPTDWWAVVFNPSFPYRFAHMTLAAFLGTAFMVGGTGAWHLLRNRANPHARIMFSMALWMVAVVAPLQLAVGDQHGENTLEHQPQKVAAMEGDWNPSPPGAGEPLILFALPDMERRTNRLEIAIPRVASLYLRHNLTGTIRALNEFPVSDIPPVPVVFFAFRIMVGLGLVMIALGVIAIVLRWRRLLYERRWFQYVMVAMSPAGFIAMLAGWTVTEVGRQPYTVFGLLRTGDSASRVSLSSVSWSAGVIVTAYLVVFGIGITLLLRMLARAPQTGEEGPHPELVARLSGGGQAKTAGPDMASTGSIAHLLPFIAAATLAFAVITYVLLDGTDLGVGILFLVMRDKKDRELMLDTILPVWEANQTWLVLGGAGLIAMFPLAYGIFLQALYLVFFTMLIALVFRGTAIGFREHAKEERKPYWDRTMLCASLLAAFCQGALLGSLIQGVHVDHSRYAGAALDWLSPFSVFCGCGLIVGYAWLGASWLVWRCEGPLQGRARRAAAVLTAACALATLTVGVWTLRLDSAYCSRWFDAGQRWMVCVVAVLYLLCAAGSWAALHWRRDTAPLVFALGWFIVSFGAVMTTMFPFMLPPSLTVVGAAAPDKTLAFVLSGSAALIPAILGYSTFAFWVFRGRVR